MTLKVCLRSLWKPRHHLSLWVQAVGGFQGLFLLLSRVSLQKMLQGKGFWPKPFPSARDPLEPLYVGSVQPPCRSPGGWLKCPPKGDPREMHQALSPVGLTPSVGINSTEDANCGVIGCFRSAEHFTQLELKECSPQCPEEAVQFPPVSR